MNDTKWRELCACVYDLPFSPAYQVKSLYEDEPTPVTLEATPWYLGDWAKTYEAHLGAHIEWIKVAPRYRRSTGQVIPSAIEDCSDQLRALLARLRIPYTENDGFFTIFGHSTAIDFATPV